MYFSLKVALHEQVSLVEGLRSVPVPLGSVDNKMEATMAAADKEFSSVR